MPDGLQSIGKSSFHNSAITKIQIPRTVVCMGNDAFNKCQHLSSVTLPEGLNTIESNCFFGNSVLNQITIPEGTQTIGEAAFAVCRNLHIVSLPDTLTSI